MKPIYAALTILALGFSIGCYAQVPPASNGYEVVLSATAALPNGNWLGCVTGQPQCTYAVYAETITGTACDPASSANFKEITAPAARPTTPNFTDTPTTGLTRCYDMETVQGTQNSAPSNVTAPVVSPGVPLAPTLQTPTPQAAELEKPALPNASPVPQLAKKPPSPVELPGPTGLVAVVRR